MVSQSTEDRLRRIADFKDRVSALRATSKVYNLKSDKSITTLDSNTTGGSSAISQVAPKGKYSPNRRDVDSEKRDTEELKRSSPVKPSIAARSGLKKNPFEESDDEDSTISCPSPQSQHGSAAPATSETINLNAQKSPNPFNKSSTKSPNPFDDDDSSCSSCSSVQGSCDDDSFTGLANTFRKCNNGRKPARHVKNTTKPALKPARCERSAVINASPRITAIRSEASSRNSDIDTSDSVTAVSNGKSAGSDSIDGALFSGFQDVLQGKKVKSLSLGKEGNNTEENDAAEYKKPSFSTSMKGTTTNQFNKIGDNDSNFNKSPSSSQPAPDSPAKRETSISNNSKSPNPFDDDDSDCSFCSSVECSYDDNSSTGMANTFRKSDTGGHTATGSNDTSKSATTSILTKTSTETKASVNIRTKTSETSSRNSDFDTLDGATAVSNGHSTGSESLDGALFSGFQDAMHGKKAAPVQKAASFKPIINSGSSNSTSCSGISTQQEKKSVTFVVQSNNAKDDGRLEGGNLLQISAPEQYFSGIDEKVKKSQTSNPSAAQAQYSSSDRFVSEESSTDPSSSSWQSESSTEISFLSSVVEEQAVTKSSAQLFAQREGNPFIDSEDDELSEVSKPAIEENLSPPRGNVAATESSISFDDNDEEPEPLTKSGKRKAESKPSSDPVVRGNEEPHVSMQSAAGLNTASVAKHSNLRAKGDQDSVSTALEQQIANTKKNHPASKLQSFTDNGTSNAPVSNRSRFESITKNDNSALTTHPKINTDNEVVRKEEEESMMTFSSLRTSLASRLKETIKSNCKDEPCQNLLRAYADESVDGRVANSISLESSIQRGSEIQHIESDDGLGSACSVATSFDACNALKTVSESNRQGPSEQIISQPKVGERTVSVTEIANVDDIETVKDNAKSVWEPKALCSLESSSSLGSSFDSTVDNDGGCGDNSSPNILSNKFSGKSNDNSISNVCPSDDGVLFSDFQDVIRSKKVDALEKYRIRKNCSVGSMVFESSTADVSLSSCPPSPCKNSGGEKFDARTGHVSKSGGTAEKLKSSKIRSKFHCRYTSAPGSDTLGGSSLESIEESMEEELYTGLKKALSKIQSVDYEEGDAKQARTVDEKETRPIDEDLFLEDEKPIDMKSHISIPDGSCAISSLKDEKFENLSITNEGSYEEHDEIASVPKCPAPLERPEEVVFMASGFAGAYDIDEEVSYVSKGKEGKLHPKPEQKPIVMKQKIKVNSPSEEPVLTTSKNFVLRDGSISTKDTILGRTIQVGNVDLAAERIYLESLRAQVHAELKVHVADEEIRLALDARLGAIRDFYKRKATVAQLKLTHQNGLLERAYAIKTFNAAMNSHPPIQSSKSMPRAETAMPDKIGKKKVSNSSEILIKDQVVKSMSAPICVMDEGEKTDNAVSKNTHKFAFERAQESIDQAIKAANIPDSTPAKSDEVKNHGSNNFDIDVDASGDSDEDDIDEEFDFDEIDVMDEAEASKSSIPKNIVADEAFWEEDQIIAPSPSSHSSVEKKFGTAVTSAWAFFRFIDGLMFDSRLYDYKFQQLQEDPLYPYLNSLVGIADGGEDGYINENKRIMQKPKKEYMNQSPLRICHSLAREAVAALPKLQVICADIGGRLGMQTIAVGKKQKIVSSF